MSLLGLGFTLNRTVFLSAQERALKVFDSDANTETMKAFVAFVSEYGRSYADHQETAMRYQNYLANMEQIRKYQEHEFHLPYRLSVQNQFADLSPAEFVALMGNGTSVPQSVMRPEESFFKQEAVPILDKVEGEIPADKNWVEEGLVGASSQDTSAYGYSWAFSATAALEALAAINGQANLTMSAQQLIDCDTSNNGWAYKGFAYASKYGMMADYPFTGRQGECLYDESKPAFKNTDMVQERYVSNERLKSLVARQPVTTGLVVTSNFRLYKSGVMTEELLQCSNAKNEINHSVTLVGYGKTDKKDVASTFCTEYWLARSNFGAAWGEQGLFKLCMDGAG